MRCSTSLPGLVAHGSGCVRHCHVPTPLSCPSPLLLFLPLSWGCVCGAPRPCLGWWPMAVGACDTATSPPRFLALPPFSSFSFLAFWGCLRGRCPQPARGIYTYIYIYIYIYMYIYIYIVDLFVYLFLFIYIYVYMHNFIYLTYIAPTYTYTNICIYIYI